LLENHYHKSPVHIPRTIKELNDPKYKAWIIEVLDKAPRKEAEEHILASLIPAIQDFTREQNFEFTNSSFGSQDFFCHAIDTIWRGCTRLSPDLVPTFNNWVSSRLSGAVKDFRRKYDPLNRQDRLIYKECQEKMDYLHLQGETPDIWDVMLSVMPEELSLEKKKARAVIILNRVSNYDQPLHYSVVSSSEDGNGRIPSALSTDGTDCPDGTYENDEYINRIIRKAKRIGLLPKEIAMLLSILEGNKPKISDVTKSKLAAYLVHM
jgi:hypothetical protein